MKYQKIHARLNKGKKSITTDGHSTMAAFKNNSVRDSSRQSYGLMSSF